MISQATINLLTSFLIAILFIMVIIQQTILTTVKHELVLLKTDSELQNLAVPNPTKAILIPASASSSPEAATNGQNENHLKLVASTAELRFVYMCICLYIYI